MTENKTEFLRIDVEKIIRRCTEPRRFIQILAGPRQVGKTTAIHQAIQHVGRSVSCPIHYASADQATLKDRSWITQQWEIARLRLSDTPHENGAILVLDEIQKIHDWSDTIKALWDEDTRRRISLKVFILGSAPLLIERGAADSLAGRFEVIRVSHWTLAEMASAFEWDAERFVFFGGYPGSAPLIADEERWRAYVSDALIETTLSRDILTMVRVDKPALLRRLLHLGCLYSGQILSYEKMIGQLQDVGNTTTLAHYLKLLGGAGLITGLEKFSDRPVRAKGSSPKFQVMNNALLSALQGRSFDEIRHDPEAWGRWMESAIGSHLINGAITERLELFYWRDRQVEVDFVLKGRGKIVAIEVKTTRKRDNLAGISEFKKRFGSCKTLLVGGNGMTVDEFLRIPVGGLL